MNRKPWRTYMLGTKNLGRVADMVGGDTFRNIAMNFLACGGDAWIFVSQHFSMLAACSGSHDAGQAERGGKEKLMSRP